MWNFCPSIAPAYVLAVLFALTTIAHLGQAIYYKKPYCWVIVISGLAQTLCYIFRILSILNPDNFGSYAAWFILILVRRSYVGWDVSNISTDCAVIYECVCVYGDGKDGVELYLVCEDLAHLGLETWDLLCGVGCFVRFPYF